MDNNYRWQAGIHIRPRTRTGWSGRLIFGLILVWLGTLWTLDNLGVLDADQIVRYWPLLIVLYGVSKFTGIGSRRSLIGGGFFSMVGVWWLLYSLDIIHRGPWGIWPMFLIVAGVLVVMRSVHRPADGAGDSDDAPYPRPFAFMGGVTRRLHSQDLRGAEATAILGGVVLDFRNARPVEKTITVDVVAVWGGVEITVPEDWTVASEVTTILGGLEDATRAPEHDPVAHLVVRGLAMMGGVSVGHGGPRTAHRVHVVTETGEGGGRGTTTKEVTIAPTGITIRRTRPGSDPS